MPNKRQLHTTEAVVEALGGDQYIAQLFGIHTKAVSNWRYFGFFPANTADALRGLLQEKNLTASPTLWAMKAVRKQGRK